MALSDEALVLALAEALLLGPSYAGLLLALAEDRRCRLGATVGRVTQLTTHFSCGPLVFRSSPMRPFFWPWPRTAAAALAQRSGM